MIIPKYWAEHKERRKCNPKSITFKRIGWSEISQYEAEKMAQNRVDEAFKKIESGEKVVFIERRVAYNGTDGMPIREEILSESGEAVITRNIYGAQCLNVKDVLFVDIDYDLKYSSYADKLIVGLGAIISIILLIILKNGYFAISLFVIFSAIGIILRKICFDDFDKKLKIAENNALDNIEQFCQKYSEFKFRVYKTPAGLRLLAINDLYNPKDETTVKFYERTGIGFKLYSNVYKSKLF